MTRCSKCGSDKVLSAAWVERNTFRLKGSPPGWPRVKHHPGWDPFLFDDLQALQGGDETGRNSIAVNWCEGCHSHTDLVEESARRS